MGVPMFGMTPEMMVEVLRTYRHLRHETLCDNCKGWGTIWYSSTALWRGGMGGASMTPGVCDTCWGSGTAERPWENLRKNEATERDRVTERAARLLDDTLGQDFTTMVSAQRALADLIDAARRKRKLPPGVDFSSWSALCTMLIKRLHAFADAGEAARANKKPRT